MFHPCQVAAPLSFAAAEPLCHCAAVQVAAEALAAAQAAALATAEAAQAQAQAAQAAAQAEAQPSQEGQGEAAPPQPEGSEGQEPKTEPEAPKEEAPKEEAPKEEPKASHRPLFLDHGAHTKSSERAVMHCERLASLVQVETKPPAEAPHLQSATFCCSQALI